MLMLAACQNYPRDTAGTLERIQSGHVVRVGLIAGEAEARDQAKIAAYLDRVSNATGAVSYTHLDVYKRQLDMLLEQDAPPRPAETADPAFRADVLRGFADARRRAIPARWFYDRRGSELFEQITTLPEYLSLIHISGWRRYIVGAGRVALNRLPPGRCS